MADCLLYVTIFAPYSWWACLLKFMLLSEIGFGRGGGGRIFKTYWAALSSKYLVGIACKRQKLLQRKMAACLCIFSARTSSTKHLLNLNIAKWNWPWMLHILQILFQCWIVNQNMPVFLFLTKWNLLKVILEHVIPSNGEQEYFLGGHTAAPVLVSEWQEPPCFARRPHTPHSH